MINIIYGLLTGLLITFFDGGFLWTGNLYIPSTYPFHLLMFNVTFWTVLGLLSGLIRWLVFKNKAKDLVSEGYYRTLFFTLPFIIVYGILSRLNIPQMSPPVVFDHHLSFVWVAVMLCFMLLYYKKKPSNKKNKLFFLFEIATIIVLFRFCSNLESSRIIKTVYTRYINPLLGNTFIDKNDYNIIVYIMGVVIILGVFYTILFGKFHFKRLQQTTKYIAGVAVLVLLIIMLGNLYPKNPKVTFQPKSSPSNRNFPVILIVLDTVRADYLSVYAQTELGQNILSFSQDALIFDNCIATSSWTLPSHASLFTGFYPSEHGVHKLLKLKEAKDKPKSPARKLSDNAVTLAETFIEKGYVTAGISSNGLVKNPGYNLHQGFQIFDNSRSVGFIPLQYPVHPMLHLFCYLINYYPKYNFPYLSAEEINSIALTYLNKIKSKPFFLFLNYMDAHVPYNPPSPFDRYFCNNSFPQLSRLKKDLFGMDFKDLISYQQSQYKGEIAYLDHSLSRFFALLKERGIYDSALIIITSDHGELFRLSPQLLLGHKKQMYQGALKVPLMIKYPYNQRVGRYPEKITLADLYSTILSICDFPIAGNISGRPFGTNIPVVAELYKDSHGEHYALYDGKYKYMRYGKVFDPELYDLEKDPKELNNLSLEFPIVLKAMEEKLNNWKNTHQIKYDYDQKPSKKIDEEMLKDF